MKLTGFFPWLFAVLLFVLAFVTTSASAGMTPEEVKVFESDKALALSGDPVGQCNLGFSYKTGSGVQQDMVEAVKWYRKAANQGVAQAQVNLGCSYYRGTGIEKDMTEAVKLFRKAADHGFEHRATFPFPECLS